MIIRIATPDQLRSHLQLVHGVWVGDVKTTAGLRDAHAATHEEPWTTPLLDHRHDGG